MAPEGQAKGREPVMGDRDSGAGSVTEAPTVPRDKLEVALEGMLADQYGSEYRNHTLEIYKTYVEMADRISERREKANTFFLTVNTAAIVLLAKGAFGMGATAPQTQQVLVPFTAGVLCYLWYRLIRSYRDLSSAKFRVIHVMEHQLPLRPYDAEWESVQRGKNPKLYLPFTHVEGVVPWLFMTFHAFLAASAIPWAAVWTALKGI